MTLLPEKGTLGSRLAALGLLVGLLLCLGLWAVLPWASHITSQRNAMGEAQQRIARAEHHLSTLKSTATNAPSAADIDLSALAISAPSATRASARLVQLAKEEIAAASCNVVSLEARPAEAAAIGIQLMARAKLVCDTPNLQKLLHRLESMQPVMLVSALRVRSRAGQAHNSDLLDIELDLSAFLIKEILPGEVKS